MFLGLFRLADVAESARHLGRYPLGVLGGQHRGDAAVDPETLRDRRDDIPLLVNYFLEKIAREHSRKPKSIANAAIKLFEKYHLMQADIEK